MPQSDSDRSRILVATLAEPPQRGIPVGCIAAVAHSYEYLATEDQELSYVERKQLIKDLLAASERYRGPAVLRPSVNLITARRWQQAGEDERALALLDQIPDPSVVPGVYRLRGDIQFARGEYEDAVASYRAFIALLGPVPHAQGREAKGYEIYSYGNELADLCEQQGDVTRAFTLVPTDAMFRIVSRRLLQDFDWPNCGRFLRTSGEAFQRDRSQD